MEEKIKAYRRKIKKCKWCKYFRGHTYEVGHWIVSHKKCIPKDKTINYENILRLCKYYELKEEKNEES